MQTVRKRRIGRSSNFILKSLKIIPSEYEECKAFWDYCQKILRLGMRIIHHANEGKRDEWYGRALKRIGLTAGVFDYQYVVSNDKYHSLWIEMKRKDGREKPKRPEQEAFMEMLNSNGHYATYAYGCEDAIKIYTDYVNNRL